MNATLERLADLTVQAVGEAVAENHMPENVCVEATGAFVWAAREFGQLIRPVVADALVLNREGLRCILRELPADQWPDDAWSIGVDTNSDTGYPAHLVAMDADHTLYDLTARQFHRPKRDLIVPRKPVIFPVDKDIWQDGGFTVAQVSDSASIGYRRMAQAVPDYRAYTAWRNRNVIGRYVAHAFAKEA